MVELVGGAGQVVDIGADGVGRAVPVGLPQTVRTAGQGQHQVGSLLGFRRQQGVGLHLAGILGQDGLDPDDGIENIGAGIALKGGKALQVEDIILGGLVAQVAVLQSGHGNETGGILHLAAVHHLVLRDFFADIVRNLRNQRLQPHDAAGPGFEGLAVLAVHGAEADVLQLRFRRHDAGLPGGPEYLLKMQGLALVREIEHLAGTEVLHPLNQGGQIRGSVDGGAVGFHQNAGGNFLGIGFLLDGNDQGTVGDHGDALGLHVLDHGRNIGLGVAFSHPHVEADVEVGVVLLQIGHGDAHDVLPHGPVAPVALLELEGGVVGTAGKVLVHLALGAGAGVDLLQLRDGEGGLCGVFSGEGRIKIGQLRPALPDFLDNQAHLQTPVAQVNVADDPVAEIAADTFEALADDGGAQVSHMQRFGHVGPTVIHDDGAGIGVGLHAEALGPGHTGHIIPQEGGGDVEVQKAGIHGGDHGEHGVALQLGGHGLGDLNGGPVVGLGGWHGAVALVLAQVRAVGYGDPAESRFKPGVLESLRNPLRNQIYEFFHEKLPFSHNILSPLYQNRPGCQSPEQLCGQSCRQKAGEVGGQGGGDGIARPPDARRTEIDADGIEGGLRAAQHDGGGAADEGVRPISGHELAAHSQGGAAGDGADDHQGSRLRRNAQHPAKRRHQPGQQVHGAAGPQHPHGGQQHHQSGKNAHGRVQTLCCAGDQQGVDVPFSGHGPAGNHQQKPRHQQV